MENKKKFDVIRPLIDEAFEKGESFVFVPNGISMLPFIRGGFTEVEIEKYKGGAKKHDIVFYQRSDGKYVLHRIVKLYKDCYGVCGDNQWWVEKVYDKDIFAVVVGVGDKRNKGGFLYLNTLGIRRFIKHVRAYVNKHMGGSRK